MAESAGEGESLWSGHASWRTSLGPSTSNCCYRKPRYTFDCDDGSLLLTVADAPGLPPSLVEITLPGGSGHNFVRWKIDEKTIVDWDTNGRAQCIIPLNNPSFQGKIMSHEQTLSYILFLRAGQLARSIRGRGQEARAIAELLRQDRSRRLQMPG